MRGQARSLNNTIPGCTSLLAGGSGWSIIEAHRASLRLGEHDSRCLECSSWLQARIPALLRFGEGRAWGETLSEGRGLSGFSAACVE